MTALPYTALEISLVTWGFLPVFSFCSLATPCLQVRIGGVFPGPPVGLSFVVLLEPHVPLLSVLPAPYNTRVEELSQPEGAVAAVGRVTTVPDPTSLGWPSLQ